MKAFVGACPDRTVVMMAKPDLDELGRALDRTLDDGRLSRSERSALRSLLEDADLSEEHAARLRAECFAKARDAAGRYPGEQGKVWDWCEDVIQLLAAVRAGGPSAAELSCRALFSPRQPCWKAISELVERASRSIDICVFTITDDRIANAVAAAHQRGTNVRIVTDDDKSQDPGSDVFRLRDAGVPVAWDRGPEHMHHKFAVFDGQTLLTGSYNWTRGAAHSNQENIVVTDERRLVSAFGSEFDRLWREFARV